MPPSSTLEASPRPSIRLQDGSELTCSDVLDLGLDAIVRLSEAELLPDADAEDVANLVALPSTLGDDHLDVMLGARNLAANAELLDYPTPSVWCDQPAIVVGSAPSLDHYIDRIRELADSRLIVCAHSAAARLIEAGIVPHVVAPKERTRAPSWCLDGMPSDVIYGGMMLVPSEHQRFTRKLCVGDSNALSEWAGCGQLRAIGPTSGTLAAALALDLTTGPVYLVGMDGAGTHYATYRQPEDPFCERVLCHDGEERDSHWVYRIARATVRALQERYGRLIQVSETAAVVPGIEHGTLPCRGRRLEPPHLSADILQQDSLAFRAALRVLPGDWDRAINCCRAAYRLSDTNHWSMIEGRNQILLGALLGPLYSQLSMERRFGMADDDVMAWFREASVHVLEAFIPTITEMAGHGTP